MLQIYVKKAITWFYILTKIGEEYGNFSAFLSLAFIFYTPYRRL